MFRPSPSLNALLFAGLVLAGIKPGLAADKRIRALEREFCAELSFRSELQLLNENSRQGFLRQAEEKFFELMIEHLENPEEMAELKQTWLNHREVFPVSSRFARTEWGRKYLEVAEPFAFSYVKVPRGKFQMGTDEEGGPFGDEFIREVELTKGFELKATLTTIGEWVSLGLGLPEIADPRTANRRRLSVSEFEEHANEPVVYVSWEGAQRYIARLNEQKDGYFYFILTEAQWEYALRWSGRNLEGGMESAYAFGNSDALLGDYSWNDSNSANPYGRVHPVAKKKPTGSFFDLHGNAWEWVADRYIARPEGNVDPTGPPTGVDRVLRGGSWCNSPVVLRSALRSSDHPGNGGSNLSFRPARIKIE